MVSGLGGQIFNTLNAELNPICNFLALLEAHHILHISRIRVNWHCAKYRSLSQHKQYTNNGHVGTPGEQVNFLKGEFKLLMPAKIRDS
jgi:hypothetical protein